MKSYMSIDRIEESIAVCEVELVDVDKSKITNIFDKETEMKDVPLKFIKHYINEEPVEEGDIFVVEYDETSNSILWIYNRDDEERLRRLEIIKKLINRVG